MTLVVVLLLCCCVAVVMLLFRIFTLKPSHGLITDQYQLVVLQMLSPESIVQRCVLEYQLCAPVTSYIKVCTITAALGRGGGRGGE